MDAKTMCLGVLALGEASGYEIRKHFEEGPFSHFHEVGFGSIYPALGKLRSEGLVTVREMAQDGRPDKKVYRITEAGREAFRRALRKAPAPDKFRSDNLFMLFFAEMLDSERRREVFDAYLASHRAALAHMAGCSGQYEEMTSGQEFVFRLGLAFYRGTIAAMEENRRLLFPGDDDGEEAG